MSKIRSISFGTLASLACVVLFCSSAVGQTCCSTYVVYKSTDGCCCPVLTYVTYCPTMTTSGCCAMVDAGVTQNQVAGEGEMAETQTAAPAPVVYEEQLVWTGCCWRRMFVAVTPAPAAVADAASQTQTQTVARVPYDEKTAVAEPAPTPDNGKIDYLNGEKSTEVEKPAPTVDPSAIARPDLNQAEKGLSDQ